MLPYLRKARWQWLGDLPVYPLRTLSRRLGRQRGRQGTNLLDSAIVVLVLPEEVSWEWFNRGAEKEMWESRLMEFGWRLDPDSSNGRPVWRRTRW
jgi:hypothetical protein